jgi:hypothetical protein
MKKKLSYTKDLLLTQWLQLLIAVACFYLFSSKIAGIAWYSPLTTYMLLYLIVTSVLQLSLCVFIGFRCENNSSFKRPLIISLLELIVLLSMIFLCIGSIWLFSIVTVFYSLLELLLLVYLLHTILKLY